MDRVHETIHEFVSCNEEAQIEEIEKSVTALVQQELAALALEITVKSVAQDRRTGKLEPPLWSGADSANLLGSLGNEILDLGKGFGHRPVARATPETMWDAAALAGLSTVGIIGTSILATSLFSSVCLQAFMLHFWMNPVTVQEEVGKSWQQIIAPAGNQSSPVSVANNIVSLLLHSASNVAATELSPLAGPLQGAPDMLKVMSTLTVLFWLLCVACELRRALGTALSLCVLPRCATRLAKSGDRFLFVSISSGRLLLVAVVTFVRIGMACSLLAHGAGRLSRARSLTDLVVNVGALSIILDVPTFVWTRGCNGGLWSRFLDVESRVSFADCLLEYNWAAEDEVLDEPEVSEEPKPSSNIEAEDCGGEGEAVPREQPSDLPAQEAEETIEEPLRQAEQVIEQPIQQSMEQPTGQPDQQIAQAVEQEIEQPSDQLVENAVDQLVENAIRSARGELAGDPVDQPMDQQVAQQVVQQHTDQPVEETVGSAHAGAPDGTEVETAGQADGASNGADEGTDDGAANEGADEPADHVSRWSSAWSSAWNSAWVRKLIQRQGATDGIDEALS